MGLLRHSILHWRHCSDNMELHQEPDSACHRHDGGKVGLSCFTVYQAYLSRKLLSYGDPVCRHWPEYAGADQAKAQVTIADILRHEGGMPVFSAQMKVEDCFRENAHNNNIGQIIEREPLNYPEGQYK